MKGRIPESFINDLLARVDIVDVVTPRVELKRAGREWRGLSPFTNEKTPSFYVSPAKQMYFDFSSGQNGNAIGFLMAYERLDFVEAVEELASQLGLEVPREGGRGGPSRKALEGPLEALALAQRHFEAQLRRSQVAIDYLKQRGVDGATAQARFFSGHLLFEDAATGSAAGALGAFLAGKGVGDDDGSSSEYVIDQGDYIGRPSRIFVKVDREGDKISSVEVSGNCRHVFEGDLLLESRDF